MPIPRSLMFVAVLLLFFNGTPSTNLENCDTLKVKIDTIKSRDSAEFEITIRASGGRAPYHYILLDKGGKPLSHDNSRYQFKNIKSGTYRCIVVDGQECKKDLYVDVK